MVTPVIYPKSDSLSNQVKPSTYTTGITEEQAWTAVFDGVDLTPDSQKLYRGALKLDGRDPIANIFKQYDKNSMTNSEGANILDHNEQRNFLKDYIDKKILPPKEPTENFVFKSFLANVKATFIKSTNEKNTSEDNIDDLIFSFELTKKINLDD